MSLAILTLIPLLLIAASSSGQQPAPKSRAACGAIEEWYGLPQKQPVVYGEPYIVPKLRLRITDERTGVPIARREVIVRYVWRWFEYPYQEHPLGVWSDAYELVRCRTNEDGVIEVPEFKVVPRGWYKGKLLMGRRPEFTHLDVSVHLEKHISHRGITKGKLERYEGSKTGTIPLQVPLVSPLSQ